MLAQVQAVEIEVLARRGVSIREIAKQLRCSRNTVRRYLREATAEPQYGPREPRPTKLDPYKPYLLERIEAARAHWRTAVVLHGEIQEMGYAGGITRLRMFTHARRVGEPEPVVRFKTSPGKQMQADFAHIRRSQTIRHLRRVEMRRRCYCASLRC
jgi:transposase